MNRISFRAIGVLAAVSLGVSSSLDAAGVNAALLEAVKRADRNAVRTALDSARGNGAPAAIDVNAPEVDGTTLLHWAARGDDPAIVEMLIHAGARVSAANRYGITPLWLACQTGNGSIVERLLASGADPNTTSSEGETVLMMAARSGSVAAVERLLSRGAAVGAKESWRGQTALMWAAAEGHVDVVRALLKAGASVEARSNGGLTPLLFGVREGRLDVVRALVDAGVSVHESMPPPRRAESAEPGPAPAPPPKGMSALLVAVANAHFDVAAYLLDRGADANDSALGWTPLHQMSWVRKTGIAGTNNPPPQGSGSMTSADFVRVLVKHGADLNARVTRRPPVGVTSLNMIGATPFLLAARTADADLMRLLASLGADPRLPNADGSTPLLVAAGLGTAAPGEDPGTEPEVMEAVKVALEFGNDINAVDIRGNTVMHGAASKHVPTVVRYLAAAGAKIDVWNQQNADARTPLAITKGVHIGMNIVRSPATEAAIADVMRRAGAEVP
jgi:ankyrin repeat protein